MIDFFSFRSHFTFALILRSDFGFSVSVSTDFPFIYVFFVQSILQSYATCDFNEYCLASNSFQNLIGSSTAIFTLKIVVSETLQIVLVLGNSGLVSVVLCLFIFLAPLLNHQISSYKEKNNVENVRSGNAFVVLSSRYVNLYVCVCVCVCVHRRQIKIQPPSKSAPQFAIASTPHPPRRLRGNVETSKLHTFRVIPTLNCSLFFCLVAARSLELTCFVGQIEFFFAFTDFGF